MSPDTEDRKDEQTVSITRDRYYELVAAEASLEALEANSLEEWPGYQTVNWKQVDEQVEAHMSDMFPSK